MSTLLLTLVTQRPGRDKFCRTVQYVLRIVNGFNSVSSDETKTWEKKVASLRKILRFGNCIDILASAKTSLHTTADPAVRIANTASRVALSLYLFHDHLGCLLQQGLINLHDAKGVSDKANRWWLCAILAAIVRDLHEMRCLAKQVHKKDVDLLTFLVRYHKALMCDLVINVCDLFIPMSTLGMITLPSWLVGCAGVTSSTLGILAIIDSRFKY